MLTSGNFGLYSDTYTSLSGTGLIVGRRETTQDNKKTVMLVLNDSAATIAANAAVSFIAATASEYEVAAADSDTDASLAIGVNDNVGGTVADNVYFWITVQGFATVLVNAGISAGGLVAPSSTAGSLGASGTSQQTNIQAIEASPGGGGATDVWIN